MAIRKELKAKDGSIPAFERYQIKEAIARLDSLKEKALVAFLYLTGCRISEVVRFTKHKELVGDPILKEQIEIRPDVIIIYNVRILKRKDPQARKSIPIPRNNTEQFFIDTFLMYLDTLPNGKSPLWDHTRKWAHSTLTKVGLFPHLLRHSRVTSLVKDYNFTTARLMQFIGWKDSNSSFHYTHLNITDILEFMQKAKL
jgi:integrase